MSEHVPGKYRDLLICLFLAAVTLVVFWQVRHHDFVNFDDNEYVYENPHVQQGLAPESVAWAFAGRHVGHWHPLTSLTHLLDVTLFGLNPGGHHLTNLLLHVANTVLLFLALRRMTRCPWRSGLVALLFAVHPLHVEPVAWVSSRKDVLSTLFLMLALLAYARYVEKPGAARYVLVFVFLAFGLMSKVMLVTLPFALLLLDYWPLGRVDLAVAQYGKRVGLWKLVREKLPLLAPVGVSSLITYYSAASYGLVGSREVYPFHVRAANAVAAYGQYIVRTLWPRRLAAFYPHPGDAVPVWQVAGAALLLACVSAVVFWQIRRRPYLVVGWLWYLGTLLPVIGLVQSLHFATADKYTYVPLVGLFIMAAWGAPSVGANWRFQRPALCLLAAGAVVMLTACASLQLRHWRNSETLARHTVNVTENNANMHNNLGLALVKQGRLDEAAIQFSQAIRISDYYVKAHYNLGVTLAKQGKLDEAIVQYREAIRIDPDDAAAHYNLGNALERQGKLDDAIARYSAAVRIDPGYADAHYNLGNALERQGKLDDAIAQYYATIRADSGYTDAHNNLGIALARQGKLDEALVHFSEAVRLNPGSAEAHTNRGVVMTRQGKFDEAIEEYSKALRIDPTHPTARRNLERLRARKGPGKN